MTYEYDESELFQAVNAALSAFFFSNIPAVDTAAQLRARTAAYASVAGRFAAVTHPDFEVVDDLRQAIQDMEQSFVSQLTEFASADLRPGGKLWGKSK